MGVVTRNHRVPAGKMILPRAEDLYIVLRIACASSKHRPPALVFHPHQRQNLKTGGMRMTGDPKTFDTTLSDPVARIQKYIDAYKNDATYDGCEAVLMRNIRVIAADTVPSKDDEWMVKVVFEVDVVQQLCNPMHNMHGGAVALLADMATTMGAAPAAREGFWEFGGVSRTLSVTFIKPIRRGTTARVECTLLSVGARLSLLRCIIKDSVSHALLATAEHGKVALSAQVDQKRQEPSKL